MRIDCIIVEDEPLAQERIRGYLERLPFMNLVGVFDGAMEALTFLQSHTVDLIFLDINMGNFSGIQLLESMRIDSQVLLSTAYHEYALKGYELNVTDYLLKPYTFERFLQAIDKVRQQRGKETPADRKFIFVKTEYRLERIQLDDLIYVEGMRDYRRIYAAGKQIMTLQTFGELEQLIPPGWVCRIHKSYLVALAKIDSVGRDTVRIGDLELPLSDTYRKTLLEMIQR
ncbi:MAG: response regulator transcription factor [Bacteroidetes bacterium]|nr:response regulator transcription factor [Bacteroidota bacterium]